MQRTKKVISALLAVVMLISVFTCSVSAGAPTPSGSYKVIVSYEVVNADGNVVTTVAPGETVTVNVYSNSSVASDALTGLANSIYFDEDIYSYVEGSLTWLGLSSWVNASLSAATFMNSSTTDGAYTNSAKLWTEDEKTAQPNWDSFVYVMGTQLTSGSAYYVQENANSPMYSIKLKVADDAVVGKSADIGCPASVNFTNRKTYQNIKTSNTAAIGTGEVEATPTVALTVATPAPAYELAITPLKNQIRYNKNDDGSFKEINVRARASINAAELQELLGVTSNDDIKKAIVDAGFVFGADIDAATAKTVVNGTTVDGYEKKPVEYIQNTGSAYVYTCLVNDITDDKIVEASNFECIAYIVLNIGGTNYDFYFTNDEVVAVSPLDMYKATYEKANTTYGWDLAAK